MNALNKEIGQLMDTLQQDMFVNQREQIKKDLERQLSHSKVEQLFNSQLTVNKLTQKELDYLLSVFYTFTKKDIFKNKNKIKANNDRTHMNDIPELHYNYSYKSAFAKKFESRIIEDSIMVLFRKTKTIESKLNKDLSQFNYVEMESLIKFLKATTIESLIDKISIIERYIDFVKENNYLSVETNVTKLFGRREIMEPLLAKEVCEGAIIFSREEIMSMAEEAVNPQDGVILALLFTIGGRREMFKDLINLNKNDVDFDNCTVTIGDEIFDIDEDIIRLIDRALKSSEYYSILGEELKVYQLAGGDNVLRGVRDHSIIKHRAISMRIDRLSKYYDENFLNATNIEKSGQLFMLHTLINDGADMESACKMVLERYRATVNSSSVRRLEQRYNLHKNTLIKKTE